MATTSRGRRIPEATVARLPVYLRILLDQSESGTSNVSSEELAVGAGNLGQALAGYGGFGNRGFPVAGIVDNDPAKVGSPIGGVRVRPVAELAAMLVAAGVTSILNFAPVVLVAPPGVNVRKVDLAVELQILSYYEQRRSAASGAPLQAVPAGSRRGASA